MVVIEEGVDGGVLIPVTDKILTLFPVTDKIFAYSIKVREFTWFDLFNKSAWIRVIFYSFLFITFLVSVIQNTIIFPFIHYVSGISHPKHNYSYLFIMFLVSVIQNTIIPIYSLHISRAAELRDPWVSGY